ncbi:MAG TPA: hypothetical protein VK116_18410, partial [Planctomycetota bacterium]|nr:hypothetical protein [Planctomycetota bacterium]
MAPSLRALASRLGLSLGIVGLVLATASVSAFLSHESARALGQSKRSAERPDLETEAVIRRNVPKAEGFFEIQYTEKDEKGKARRVTAYLHVPEVEKKDDEATGPAEKDAGAGAAERDGDEDGDAGDDAAANAPSAEILVDRLLRAPTELEVGAKIALFGKPVAHDIPGRGGVATGGKDHQIQNAQVVLAGELEEFAIAREHVEERLPGYKW